MKLEVNKYKYTGDTEVTIPDLGMVKPGETVETTIVINHPNFEIVNNSKKNK